MRLLPNKIEAFYLSSSKKKKKPSKNQNKLNKVTF